MPLRLPALLGLVLLTAAPIAASQGGAPGESGLLDQGDSFTFTFGEPGTYEYHCHPHPTMMGNVTVSDAPDALDGAVAVAIRDFAFAPASIVVKPGATVTWTNEDDVVHTVTFDATDGHDDHAHDVEDAHGNHTDHADDAGDAGDSHDDHAGHDEPAHDEPAHDDSAGDAGDDDGHGDDAHGAGADHTDAESNGSATDADPDATANAGDAAAHAGDHDAQNPSHRATPAAGALAALAAVGLVAVALRRR